MACQQSQCCRLKGRASSACCAGTAGRGYHAQAQRMVRGGRGCSGERRLLSQPLLPKVLRGAVLNHLVKKRPVKHFLISSLALKPGL
eukprot:scaffold214314_cov19-Tisochrysis_lutea.AAC.2